MGYMVKNKDSQKVITLTLTAEQLEVIDGALEMYCMGLAEQNDPHLKYTTNAHEAIYNVLESNFWCGGLIMGEAKRKKDTQSKNVFVIDEPQASAMFDELCIRKNMKPDKSKEFLYLDSDSLIGYRNFPNDGMIAHKVPNIEAFNILRENFFKD